MVTSLELNMGRNREGDQNGRGGWPQAHLPAQTHQQGIVTENKLNWKQPEDWQKRSATTEAPGLVFADYRASPSLAAKDVKYKKLQMYT